MVPPAAVHPGITRGTLRVVAQCDPEPALMLEDYWEDDDGWTAERTQRGIGLTELGDIARALATGAAVTREVRAYGRVYRFVYDEHDPGGAPTPAAPADRVLWFHPMSEARMTFRVAVRDAVPALDAAAAWLLAHLDPAATRALEWRAALTSARRDLTAAARRCGLATP